MRPSLSRWEVRSEHRTTGGLEKRLGSNNPKNVPRQYFEIYPGKFVMSIICFRVGRSVDLVLLHLAVEHAQADSWPLRRLRLVVPACEGGPDIGPVGHP